ncbi:hypothetical protein [Planctomicrobium sp. SH527]|uniref:hypothetical protein n=1 Tax=Planctomicrobium sp. SH527 TaxID=3448123 RepID=UPI003F5B3736
MAWLQQLSNDQQAVVICMGGLLAGWGVLSLSFYTSGMNQRRVSTTEANQEAMAKQQESKQAA